MRPPAGVVIPARNEEATLARCLASVAAAAAAVAGEPITVVVVLDACVDRSAGIAAEVGERWRRLRRPARLVPVVATLANVGAARALGVETLLRRSACSWVATTDADSVVPEHWLAHQLAVRDGGADAWLGTVTLGPPGSAVPGSLVGDLSGEATHPHVHGANLGVTADAYLLSGGFAALRTGEDVDLARRIEAGGWRIVRGAGAAVRTSARTAGRAPAGFAADRAAGLPWPAACPQ